MKLTIEIHETAKRKPTKQDALRNLVMAFDQDRGSYFSVPPALVIETPKRFPWWSSLRDFPELAPIRKRAKKP